ncbi:MAG: hypothetical protein ABFD89_18510 [Bryobacteraceae bacterium]
MLTAILAFFQAIPAIAGGINNFTTRYYDAKVQITKARIGGDTDVAKQLVTGLVAEGQTRVEFLKTVGQSPFLMYLIGGFATPWIIYEWKVVVWDNIVCPALYGKPGFTYTITGLVADWSGVILAGIFGAGTVMGVGHMYFNRKER